MRILTNLDSIECRIHDFWFDLDEVRHDIQTGTVKVELGEDRKPPYNDCALRVTKVVKMSIADDADIRFYDFNRIKVTANTVRLISGFPLEILLEVSEGSELSVEGLHGDCHYVAVSQAADLEGQIGVIQRVKLLLKSLWLRAK